MTDDNLAPEAKAVSIRRPMVVYSPTSLPPQLQHVLDEADGDVGEVEVVEDVVVLHDGFQVVEADEVDELVDAGQVLVADGLGVVVEQEAGVEDIAGLGAVDQGVDLE